LTDTRGRVQLTKREGLVPANVVVDVNFLDEMCDCPMAHLREQKEFKIMVLKANADGGKSVIPFHHGPENDDTGW
jgi:hypothetical protein